MFVVGLGHESGVGKDAVAAILCRKYGFVRRGFADGLKEEVLEMFPDLLDQVALETYQVPRAAPIEQRVAARHRLVWVDKPPAVRALLQNYGTEVRRAADDSYWISRAAEWLRARRVHCAVVTDVRFPNELDWVMENGCGVCVVRPWARTAAGQHSSERGLDGAGWDYVLHNCSATLGELEAQVDELYQWLIHRYSLG